VPARDPVTNKVLIDPGSSLPAQFLWKPASSDVGTIAPGGFAKGFIMCHAIALSDGNCGQYDSPDCVNMPYNIGSRVNVQAAAGGPPLAFREVRGEPHSQLPMHVGFLITNPLGIPVHLRVGLRALSFPAFPLENVRVFAGRARHRLAVTTSAPFPPSLYASSVPRALFEELVDRDRDAQTGLHLEPLEIRQGFLEIRMPAEYESARSLIEIRYEVVDGECVRPFGSFVYDISDDDGSYGSQAAPETMKKTG
jgi:hypothetical protein